MSLLLELPPQDLVRGKKRLATGVTLKLHAGEVIELVGANGSGKTTLLRVLAGLQENTAEPAAGQVFLFATRPGFRSELSVRAQLEMSLVLHGRDPARAAALLTEVGLSRAAHLRVGQLSEGQTRRLMLAVMSASGRPVWLIDEPLNALDTDGVALLDRLLHRHLEAGGAALIATHQPLASRLPQIAPHLAGRLSLSADTPSLPATATPPASGPMAAGAGEVPLIWALKREMTLLTARPQDALWPAIFHWMVVSLFPFGLGPDTALLMKIAPGIFWVSALLALLLAAQRLFSADHDSGALDQMLIAGLPPSMLAAAKVAALFGTVGLPLALASLPLGVQYGLTGEALLWLTGSMTVGLISLCALAALFAALGLMARQAQVVVSLMAIPAFVPVLIFGTSVASSVQTGLNARAPLMVLGALAVLSILALPAVAGRVVRLAID